MTGGHGQMTNKGEEILFTRTTARTTDREPTQDVQRVVDMRALVSPSNRRKPKRLGTTRSVSPKEKRKISNFDGILLNFLDLWQTAVH